MEEHFIIRGCGLDIHQASITGCILRQGYPRQVKTFGTMTSELIQLKRWLQSESITHVAMESTGVYWKPVVNVLGDDFTIVLANARHIKNVPGRKTDVKDCEWICQLLRAGLLQPSFIPPVAFRELRELTRYRRKQQQQMTRYKNRIHKLLQDANIKTTSVLSDVTGVTGMEILRLLASGETDPEVLSRPLLKNKKLSPKVPMAKEALNGCFRYHHRSMLGSYLKEKAFLERDNEALDTEIQKVVDPYMEQYRLLQTIPGIKSKAAAIILAEIGVDMTVFPTPRHLASWAGLCPGNNESAGKKKVHILPLATTILKRC